MKVKLLRPENAPGLRDPITKRSPFIDPVTGALIEETDVPDNPHWRRRVRDRDIEVVGSEPTGHEPLAPLTTRAGAKR